MSWPEVRALLPHGEPMVLLDEVLRFDGVTAWCGVRLRSEAPFVEGGRVRAVVGLEYMAQCVGVCTALRALDRGEPLGGGVLVGARELRFQTGHFHVGDELEVGATLTHDGRELGSFDVRIAREGEVVVAGSLNVYRTPAGEG